MGVHRSIETGGQQGLPNAPHSPELKSLLYNDNLGVWGGRKQGECSRNKEQRKERSCGGYGRESSLGKPKTASYVCSEERGDLRTELLGEVLLNRHWKWGELWPTPSSGETRWWEQAEKRLLRSRGRTPPKGAPKMLRGKGKGPQRLHGWRGLGGITSEGQLSWRGGW